jgi:hypothetical protein
VYTAVIDPEFEKLPVPEVVQSAELAPPPKFPDNVAVAVAQIV